MPEADIPRSAAPVTTNMKCSSCIELTAAHTSASVMCDADYDFCVFLESKYDGHAGVARWSSEDWMLTEADAQRLVYHTEDTAMEHPAAIKGAQWKLFGDGFTDEGLQGSRADC